MLDQEPCDRSEAKLGDARDDAASFTYWALGAFVPSLLRTHKKLHEGQHEGRGGVSNKNRPSLDSEKLGHLQIKGAAKMA